MSKNIDSAHGTAEKSADSSEKLHEPPLWSAWNFHNKRRDWHQDFYDEIRCGVLPSLNSDHFIKRDY